MGTLIFGWRLVIHINVPGIKYVKIMLVFGFGFGFLLALAFLFSDYFLFCFFNEEKIVTLTAIYIPNNLQRQFSSFASGDDNSQSILRLETSAMLPPPPPPPRPQHASSVRYESSATALPWRVSFTLTRSLPKHLPQSALPSNHGALRQGM